MHEKRFLSNTFFCHFGREKNLVKISGRPSPEILTKFFQFFLKKSENDPKHMKNNFCRTIFLAILVVKKT